MGDLTFFLGLEVAQSNVGIHLSQQKYTMDLLHETGMLDCAPVPTPMVHSSHLSSNQGVALTDAESSSYRRLIGRLIYLKNTKPDIAFSVNKLSQFVLAPTSTHHQVFFSYSSVSQECSWSWYLSVSSKHSSTQGVQ